MFPLFFSGLMAVLAVAGATTALTTRFWPLLVAVPALGLFAGWGLWIALRWPQRFAWDERGFRADFSRRRLEVSWAAVEWYSKRWVSKLPVGSETGLATVEVAYRGPRGESRRLRVGAPCRGRSLAWSSLSFRTDDQLTPFDRYVPERRRER